MFLGKTILKSLSEIIRVKWRLEVLIRFLHTYKSGIGLDTKTAKNTSEQDWKGLNLLTEIRDELKYDLKQEQSLENNETQKKEERLNHN